MKAWRVSKSLPANSISSMQSWKVMSRSEIEFGFANAAVVACSLVFILFSFVWLRFVACV